MSKLTQHDLELLSLVADGLTSAEIAEVLNRSVHTIKSRKSRITAKLNAANITEAVFLSVLEIAEWRRANGHPDETVIKSPWLGE